MQYEATSVEGVALLKMVQLIAGSSAFQERCNVTTTEDAEPRIYWPWRDDQTVGQINEIEEARPCVIVEEGDEFDWETDAGGDQNYLSAAGSFDVSIFDNDRVPGDARLSYLDFQEFAPKVIQDIVEVAAKDDFLAVHTVTRLQKPMQSHPTNSPAQKSYWWSRYRVVWGFSQ